MPKSQGLSPSLRSLEERIREILEQYSGWTCYDYSKKPAKDIYADIDQALSQILRAIQEVGKPLGAFPDGGYMTKKEQERFLRMKQKMCKRIPLWDKPKGEG